MSDKIEAYRKQFEARHMNSHQADLLMRNTPANGPLKDKWTGETLVCPVCKCKGLDKFTGGPDIQNGEIKHADFIYDCRVCGLNLTEEEYKEA